jgi:hypothetical protein
MTELIEAVALKAWRDACFAYGGESIEGAEGEPLAAKAIVTAITDAGYRIVPAAPGDEK